MHRINNRHRQALVLRVLTYGLTLLLSVITTTVLVYVALGYNFDRNSGHVVRNGLILVNAQPSEAQIFIDDQHRSTVPGRYLLRAGTYQLRLEQAGYTSWEKSISIGASEVEEVRYPILVPENLQTNRLARLAGMRLASQSPNQQLLLVQAAAGENLSLVRLNQATPTLQQLELGDFVTRQNGRLGSFRVMQWHPGSTLVLVEHTLPSSTREVLIINTADPSSGTNISRLYEGRSVGSLQWAGRQTNFVYSLEGSTLSRLDTRRDSATVLLRRVHAYMAAEDGAVVFTRSSGASQGLETGVLSGETSAILYSTNNTKDTIGFAYARYDGDTYLAISSRLEATTTLYLNPLSPPILDQQLPLRTLHMYGTDKLLFSGNQRFLLVQDGQTGLVYDLETRRSHKLDWQQSASPLASLRWLSNFHLLATTKNNQTYLLDFDGQNSRQLLRVPRGQTLYMSQNRAYLYHFTSSSSASYLARTDLLIESD